MKRKEDRPFSDARVCRELFRIESLGGKCRRVDTKIYVTQGALPKHMLASFVARLRQFTAQDGIEVIVEENRP